MICWYNLRSDNIKLSSQIATEKEQLQTNLRKECSVLEKKEVSLQAEIERIAKSEKATSERLKKDSIQELEDAKKRWHQAERDEFKKREQKLSPKLKRDAAKAVEPKIRQLMEKHQEEIDRLQRESARELDSYKLELFKKSNIQFKVEASKIRDTERKRLEKFECEWMVKQEEMRLDHDAEMKKVRKEHDQRMSMNKKQFEAEKRECLDQHEIDMDDVKKSLDIEMEYIRVNHDREMAIMEEEYVEKMTERQRLCEK